MRVELWLKETSQPRIYEKVSATYTKGPLFCIYVREDNVVYKYPLAVIWRITEEYVPVENDTPG